jgi:cardiolipin synthase (CMP-forming)
LKVINVPNTLTVARIVIIPLFVTAVIYKRYPHALALFAVAALTDLLDGFLARATNQKTALGTFLDPLADKFLLVSSFILFSVYGWIPLWLTITVISRDLIVVIGWLLIYLITHNAGIETIFLGKAAIALQLVTLAMVLLSINLRSFQPPLDILFAATAAVTVLSGLQYIYKGLRLTDAV